MRSFITFVVFCATLAAASPVPQGLSELGGVGSILAGTPVGTIVDDASGLLGGTEIKRQLGGAFGLQGLVGDLEATIDGAGQDLNLRDNADQALTDELVQIAEAAYAALAGKQ